MRYDLTCRIAERLLRLVFPAATASAIAGDLEEDLRLMPRSLPRSWLLVQTARHLAVAVGLPTGFPGRSLRAARYAFRPWRRQPVAALVAIATLAIAFGSQTAFFAVSDALSLKPLPVDRPDQLVAIQLQDLHGQVPITAQILDEITRRRPPFTALAGYLGGRMTTHQRDAIVQEPVALVSGEFFDVLKAHALAGRLLTPRDVGATPATTAHIAVIGKRLWRSAFNARTDIVGQRIQVENVSLDIVGVVPDQQTGLQVEAFNGLVVPASLLPELVDEGVDSTAVQYQAIVGRLRDGEGLAAARSQLLAEWPAIETLTSPHESTPASIRRMTVESASTGFSFVRTSYGGTLSLLTGLASLMVIVACLGVGGLVVAATIARVPELRLRIALGATRSDLVAQLVAEAAALCVAGAAVGVAAGAITGRPLLAHLWPDVDLRDVSLSIDWRLLAFVAGSVLAAIIGASVTPGLVATRFAGRAAPGTARTATARRGLRHQVALTGQLSLTLVLVIGAGAFVRTLNAERPDDSRLATSRVFAARLSSGFAHAVAGQSADGYYRTLVAKLAALPGVESVALTDGGPFMGLHTYQHIRVSGDGRPRAGAASIECVMTFVSPGFLDTTGIALAAGRDLPLDAHAAEPSVILSTAAVRALFGDADPVGQRVRIGAGSAARDVSIVGVAHDTRYQDIRTPRPLVVYLQPDAVNQRADWGSVIIRARTPSSVDLGAVNRAVASIGQERVATFGSFAEKADSVLLKERLAASIGLFFAALGCALGAVGVYARTAQVVRQRRREFGVRLALGAAPARLRWEVVRGGAIAAAGAAIAGAPIGILLLHIAGHDLFGLRASDPTVVAIAIGVLVLVTVLASYLPARAIVNRSAIEALRGD